LLRVALPSLCVVAFVTRHIVASPLRHIAWSRVSPLHVTPQWGDFFCFFSLSLSWPGSRTIPSQLGIGINMCRSNYSIIYYIYMSI
jgi:hypothetical protein